MPIVLTVDDDPAMLDLIEAYCSEWQLGFRRARSADDMWAMLAVTSPNVLLLDVHLDQQDGGELVPLIKRRVPDVPIIMITGHGTIDQAVRCMKLGAFDFITKPLDFDRLRIEVTKAVEMNRLTLRVKDFEQAEHRSVYNGLVGSSPAMRQVYKLIDCVATTDATTLILGETGTGKEVVARAIHDRSRRSSGPYIAVNAAAIPHELIESALFGHEKGSFTGAQTTHVGFCEQADGGTLFLDEIGEMDFSVQAKLLRFLQDHVVQRVGGKSGRVVDVRVVAATNRDPRAEIANRRLREDLYYRLNVITINLPPLRDRASDVPLLIAHFLELFNRRHSRAIDSVTPDALAKLQAYGWPGNVRELQHLVEQLVVTTEGTAITAEVLPRHIAEQARPASTPTFAEASNMPSIEQMERQMIAEALQRSRGVVPDAAKQLGISEATVYRKIKKFGLKTA